MSENGDGSATSELSRYRRAFLFSLRSDGSPTCHPMTVFSTDEGILFNTYRSSAKVRNLIRAPHGAAALLLPDWSSSPSTALSISGTAELVEGATWPDARESADREDSGVGSTPTAIVGKVAERVADGKRLLLRLVPLRARRVGQR